MFQPNEKHRQSNIFGIQNTLPERLRKKLYLTEEYFFYQTIFCNIDEEDFSVLYSDKASRPNAPVNCLVAALILKHNRNWSYKELFEQIEFNLLTKTALGIDTIDYLPFDEATIFNFQNRLLEYEVETGINLLERVFDKLTKEQIKKLKLRTNIQRSDSLMATSNIRNFSRLQLLIEIILRIYRILTEGDKERFKARFWAYSRQGSGQYIYKLKSEDLPHELEKLGQLYSFIAEEIIPNYEGYEISQTYERVYNEHFTTVEGKVEVKPNSELHSGCLQSPDDLDATYREKRGESYKGQSINVTETANQANPINLITDISVNANNVDDSQVLNDRIDKIVEKSPDLEELHTDGGFGSRANDKKFEDLEISQIQTAVRGVQSESVMTIEQADNGNYKVMCPNQIVESERTTKRHKATFDLKQCSICQYKGRCPAKEQKAGRVFYFTHEDFLREERHLAIFKIPLERRKIRPNVESTVHQFTCRMTNKKLKYRGSFKTELFAFAVGIAINCGRIYRYCLKNGQINPDNSFNFVKNDKNSLIFYVFVAQLRILRIILEILKNL